MPTTGQYHLACQIRVVEGCSCAFDNAFGETPSSRTILRMTPRSSTPGSKCWSRGSINPHPRVGSGYGEICARSSLASMETVQ